MEFRFKHTYSHSLSALALVTALLVTQGCARASAASTVNKGSDGVALKGYDVLACFTESKPVMGTKEFQHEWNGAKWQFSSAANRDLFAADPGRYAPNTGATALLESARATKRRWIRASGRSWIASSTSIMTPA